MQYPYLTLLETVTVLLTLFIGIIIFYFLIKKWQETKFLVALKAIILYELASLSFYLIYPFPLLSRIFNVDVFKILDVLIFGIILFFVFYFVMKKILSMSLRRSLIVFLLMVVIIFPFLSFFRTAFVVEKIANLPFFVKETAKLEAQIKEWFEGGGILLLGPPPEPLSLKIIGEIESGTLSWPSERIREILVTIQLK